MPITGVVSIHSLRHGEKRTIVDKLELGDDVEPNIWELVFEHLQEHGEEM